MNTTAQRMTTLILLIINTLTACAWQLEGCFSVVVGKNASADSSVIFAHNEDTGADQVNYLKVPRTRNNPGEEIVMETGALLALAEEPAGYIWINLPVCDVCDTYLNDYGVAVGSDGCPSREDQPDLTGGGIVFWLRRAVAERARSAREGVKIAGKLIDQYGYASSGRSYIIADHNEAWILAVAMGRHWVAQRVPDDAVAVIPNSYTIREVNLADTSNFMGSPDLVEYAAKRGWYDPSTDGGFIFTKAYSNPGSLTHPDNIHRQWRGINLVTGKNYDVNGVLPFAVKPEKKLTINDVMSIMRDHYEDTPLDKSLLYTRGNPHWTNSGTICSHMTQYCAIAHLRGGLPTEIASLLWIAPFRPCVNTFIPIYPFTDSLPGVYSMFDHKTALTRHFDASSVKEGRDDRLTFSKTKAITANIDQDFRKGYAPVKVNRDKIEKKSFRLANRFEKRFQKRFKSGGENAIREVTRFTNKMAMRNYDEAVRQTNQPVNPEKQVGNEIRINAKEVRFEMAGGIGASWHAISEDSIDEGPEYKWAIRTINSRGSAWGGNPPVTDVKAWDQICRHASWLGLSFVRVELSARMYEPERNRFDWNNEEMAALYRILDWAEANQADVFLQQMWSNVKWNSYPGVQPLLSAPRSVPDFAEGIATLVEYLTKTKKYTCIKWICITNEPPGGGWGSWWNTGETDAPLTPALKAVREALDRKNIRIPLSGPDWTDLPPFDESKIDFDPYIGAYDIHSYQGIDEAKQRIVADWAAWAREHGKPMLLSEIGNMSLGWKDSNPGPKSFAAARSNAESILRGLAAGAGGFNRWSFTNRGDLDGQWQLIRTWDIENKKYLVEVEIEAAAYYGYGIITRFVAKHSSVLATEPVLNPWILAQTLKSPDGRLTILLLNKNPMEQTVRVHLSGADNEKLYLYRVTEKEVTDPAFRMDPLGEFTVREGKEIELILPGFSINTLSGYRKLHEDY